MCPTEAEVMWEVEVLQRLQHPHVVRVMDVIDVIDATYIVMERIDGPEVRAARIRLRGRWGIHVAGIGLYRHRPATCRRLTGARALSRPRGSCMRSSRRSRSGASRRSSLASSSRTSSPRCRWAAKPYTRSPTHEAP